jgi:hypothetical protein
MSSNTEVHEVAAHDEKIVGRVKQVNTTSVALAAAVAEQTPNIWSANMIQLYAIMSIGYLVSTMNGFGKSSSSSPALPPLRPRRLTTLVSRRSPPCHGTAV